MRVDVRRQLESDSRGYIRVHEYYQICEQNNFHKREDQLQLSSYLHFQDDPVLKHIVILNPTWGTDAVYKVLDNS
ncbi:COR domain-containing protein [Candidatus Uabimicrobium sp. HlEnr_7]|uniref:COR domain-containing protein n=1 Tax=Candidatus Uabimicrobium helgolandensis TaxID=3095367 RepID=UPI0035562A32